MTLTLLSSVKRKMPALCSNDLTIWCDDQKTIELLVESACVKPKSLGQRISTALWPAKSSLDSTGFLEFLRPTPPNLDEVEIEIAPQLAHYPKPYHWRVENWGCRSDFLLDSVERAANELKMDFSTDYSPPVKALQHGAKRLGFRFSLLYLGGEFCGLATESDNLEYELSYDLPPAEAGIPKELIDRFDLNTVYHEMLQD